MNKLLRLPRRKLCFLAVAGSLPIQKPLHQLVVAYPYNARVSEIGISVVFVDFPTIVGEGYDPQSVDDCAQHTLADILQKQFSFTDMIALPSRSPDSKSIVPEHIALEILRRNWSMSQVYYEARRRFEAARKHKKEPDDYSTDQT